MLLLLFFSGKGFSDFPKRFSCMFTALLMFNFLHQNDFLITFFCASFCSLCVLDFHEGIIWELCDGFICYLSNRDTFRTYVLKFVVKIL